PQADGVPSFGAVPSDPPVIPSGPGSMSSNAGSMPFSVTSMPHAAPLTHMPTPDHAAPAAEAPQKAVAPPHFAHWPTYGVPSESTPKAFAPNPGEGLAAPGPLANPPVPSDSSAGISAFVAQIRQTHVPGRESWVERSGRSGPQPHILRHVGES